MAIEMDKLAREAIIKRSCVKLAKLDCDKNSQFRSINGSCNNIGSPYQVSRFLSKYNIWVGFTRTGILASELPFLGRINCDGVIRIWVQQF